MVGHYRTNVRDVNNTTQRKAAYLLLSGDAIQQARMLDSPGPYRLLPIRSQEGTAGRSSRDLRAAAR
jgi:hypothetical protein